jgi:hypothetical protein
MEIGLPETEREIEIAPLEEPVPEPVPVEEPVEEPVPASAMTGRRVAPQKVRP